LRVRLGEDRQGRTSDFLVTFGKAFTQYIARNAPRG
jgi:hypothetical protein